MDHLSRRRFLGGTALLAGSGLAAPAVAQVLGVQPMANSTEMEADPSGAVRRNISAFRMLDWRPHFATLRNGAILCDVDSRAAHYWSEDESIYRLYPTSVPLTEELTRRGVTEVVQKVVNPPWRPTPQMRVRNPEWPEFVPGGDPTNPLGSRALYLSWQYYRVHGTADTRKIGRRSSNGCIGLYEEHIQELFEFAVVGTQVKLL